MTVQQHERRPVAAVADAQRRFPDVDELDLKPFEEGQAEGLPWIPSLRTSNALGRSA
jgi:hypothetical protein